MEETVRAARDRYLAANGFTEASYRDRWVHVKIGPIPVVFPNTASRRRAIPMHDLHHVATGYQTTLVGEAEIGAYEIAAGCGKLTAAWVLNASAFAYGLLLAPRKTYRAFVRGRHAHTLYRSGWRDSLLSLTVNQLRTHLGLDVEARATWRDRAAFAAWVAAVAAPWAAAIAGVLYLRR